MNTLNILADLSLASSCHFADDTLLSDSDCNMEMRARTLPVPALLAHTCAQVRIAPRNPTRPMATPARLMYHFVSYVPLPSV